jgi:hypothetical protein
VSFDQVGAGMAFLSRASGDASLSATQLSGVLNALLSPGIQGAKALEGVGLSAEKVRTELREKGLLATLDDLSTKFHGNTDAMAQLFADNNALAGALAFTGAGAQDAAQVFDDLAHSTGALGGAYAAFSGTDAAKMQRAVADTQAAMLDLGATIAPLAGDVAHFGAEGIRSFSGLPESVKQTVVEFGGLLAVFGPVASMGGRLLGIVEKVGTAFTGAEVGAAKLKSTLAGFGALTAATLILEGLSLALDENSKMHAAAKARVDSYVTAIRSETGALEDNVDAVTANDLATSKVGRTVRDAGVDMGDYLDAVRSGHDPLLAFAGDMSSAGRSLIDAHLGEAAAKGSDLAAQLLSLRDAGKLSAAQAVEIVDTLGQQSGAYVDATGKAKDADYATKGLADSTAAAGSAAEGAKTSTAQYSAALGGAASTADQLDKVIQGLHDTLRAETDPVFAMSSALRDNADAQAELDKVQHDAKATAEDLAAAHQKVAESGLKVQDASIDMTAAIRNGSVTADDFTGLMQRMVDEQLISADTAAEMGNQFVVATVKAQGFAGDYVAHAYADVDNAVANLGLVDRYLTTLDGRVIHVRVDYSSNPRPTSGLPGSTASRWGNIVHAYAAGGIEAHVASGEVLRYAEPETGGEAFVPRLGDRARSLAVLDEALSWYGERRVLHPPSGMPDAGGGGTATIVHAPVSVGLTVSAKLTGPEKLELEILARRAAAEGVAKAIAKRL